MFKIYAILWHICFPKKKRRYRRKTEMLLAIDVGNSNIVFGISQNDKWMGTFRLTTTENRTSDEIGLMILQFFRCFEFNPNEVEDVIIASVVPPVMHTLKKAIVKYIGKEPLIVDEDIFPSIQYEGEDHLGADRSVCCEAAIAKYGKPLIVLDLGTATTIDAINEDGWYLGGSILAGLQITTDALFYKASKLPRIDLKKPSTVLGCNTIEQIQAGSVCGYIGCIEHLLRETKREMGYGDDVKVIATGGLAQLMNDHTNMFDIVDNDLIMDGLRVIYQNYKNNLN